MPAQWPLRDTTHYKYTNRKSVPWCNNSDYNCEDKGKHNQSALNLIQNHRVKYNRVFEGPFTSTFNTGKIKK